MKLKSIVESVIIDTVKEELQTLLESPNRKKTWTDSNLENSYKNNQFTKLVFSKAKNVGKFDGYEIYQYSSKKSTIDCFIEGEMTVAFFMYQKNYKTIIEEKVWQEKSHLGLCRRILFDYYLKNSLSVLSDMLHSESGEKYWKKNMIEAKKLGYEAMVYHSDTGEIEECNEEKIEEYYKDLNARFYIKNESIQ